VIAIVALGQPKLSPASAGTSRYTAAATTPNVLLIMTDDQTYDTIRRMPELRALQARGTTFTDYHANFALCCPSRTTTITGQYVHNHGVWANGGPEGGYPAFAPSAGNSLPVWLQEAGYQTMMVGKYLNQYNGTTYGVPPGWDRWRVTNSDEQNRYFDPRLFQEDGQYHDYAGYTTDVYADIATSLIEESAATRQPWFMWLAPNAPHVGSPVDLDDSSLMISSSPAPRYRDKFEGVAAPTYGDPVFNELDVRDKPRHVATLPRMSAKLVRAVNETYSQQLETLQSVDDMLAQVQTELDATGQSDDTVIMFTTDNGVYFGEHRIKAGKKAPYTAASHMPLVVAGPGFAAGQVRTEPRLNTDLAPTILELTGAIPGRVQDGTSLMKVVSENRPLLMEGRIGGGSGGVHYQIRQFTALRLPRWFYARYRYTDDTLGVELYRLTSDPDMLQNLAGNNSLQGTRKRLRATMETMAGYAV
jgi:arylsulfatase A-like enzyme